MDIAIKIVSFTALLIGLATPIWICISILFQRGFKFRKSRIIPLVAVYGIAVFCIYLFWDKEKFGYNVLQLILYGSIYFFIGAVFSWLVSLKSKQWRSLLQIASLSLLSVPLVLFDFSDWKPLYILSLWGGLSGMYFLGYSINATWKKEHTLSGVIPFGSFLFVLPYFITSTITPEEQGEIVQHHIHLYLVSTLVLSSIVQAVRSVKTWPVTMFLVTGLVHAALSSGIGYLIIQHLPDFKANSASVDPEFLVLFAILGSFSGLSTYLISLKAKLFKSFTLFAFLQDRTFVLNIERYAYLLLWGILIWVAHFLCGVPGVIFLAIGGLGSLLVNYTVHFTNTVLYGWSIAVFILFISGIGEIVGGTSIDLAQPKVILWATLGSVGVGLHLFFSEVQKLILIRRNSDIILILSIIGVVVLSILSVYIFNVFELLGGVDAAFSMLIILLFSVWLRNDRSNLVNPLWVAFSWVALMVPSVQRDNPNDFSNNEKRSKIVQESKSEDVPKTPFDLSKVQGKWTVNTEESKLVFTLVSDKGDTYGQFSDFSGSITVENNDLKVNFVVSTASVDTENSTRDKSLREEEGFFEVDQYPHMTFKSSSVSKSDTGYVAVGDYTLLAETKTIEIPFNILGKAEDNGQEYMIIEGHTSIKPEEYGMDAAASLGDRVDIKFSINCVRE